ncbi:MAG: winged helix-turn-helix domain-containing protein [Caldilineaceae bacterium]|nr:winged helix-turn-helix domain-containing protein [Caldilineaceae bacterium]
MPSPIQDKLFARSQLQSIAEGLLALQPRNFSLIGAKFMGKTRILNHLAAPDGPLLGEDVEMRRAYELIVVYYDCAWPDAATDLLAFLADGLRRHLQQLAAPPAIDLEQIRHEPQANERLRRLVVELRRAGYRPILLLDNFDTLITGDVPDDMEWKINQLRPLTRELGLVVASERPLHEANRELASSPLFNLLNQVFLRLIEPQEMREILRAVTAGGADQDVLIAKLSKWTGGHPFLLSRIGEILLDVDEMLPGRGGIGLAHLPLIRLRLTEDYGRLLFGELWSALQDQEDPYADGALALVRCLLTEPLPLDKIQPQWARSFYWLLNKGIVRIENDTCYLFSSLFEEYIGARLEQPAPAKTTRSPAAIPQNTRTLIEEQVQQFTPQERNLLRYFLDHPGEIVSIDQLLADVWKRPNASARRVQEGIRRLRNRMEALQLSIGEIENEWGEGYRFVPVRTEPRR